jgi:hypothetical protein
MSSKAMAGEGPRIPHRADATTEVGDLRADVDAAFERAEVITEKVTLTAAQLKALAATPAELVAAAGASTVLQLLGSYFRLRAGSEVLAEAGDNLAIKYKNGSGAAVTEDIETTGFIDQTGVASMLVQPKAAVLSTSQGEINAALVLHNLGSEFTGNVSDDAEMDVYVMYRILQGVVVVL